MMEFRPERGTIIHHTPEIIGIVEKDKRSFLRRVLDFIRREQTVTVCQIGPGSELWVRVRYIGEIDNKHSFMVI